MSSRMINRIFSGAVTRGKFQAEGKMTYAEFVWFLLSEEDKRHPTRYARKGLTETERKDTG